MRINRLDSLHARVVVLVNAKLKEYSDWLGDNTTVPNAAGWVKSDLVVDPSPAGWAKLDLACRFSQF